MSPSEISMPPLASLSLNPTQPPAQSYQSPNPASYYTQHHQTPQPQPIRQSAVHAPAPVEAQIQSWADNLQPQQPRPMPPVVATGAWTPDMGIRFSGPPAAGGSNPAQSGAQTP